MKLDLQGGPVKPDLQGESAKLDLKGESVKLDLQGEFELAMKTASQTVDDFPWEHQPSYMHWLFQSYSFVRRSTRLLALASGHAGLKDENLHRRMIAHLKEEAGHEMLAARDLEMLGGSLDQFTEFPETSSFYQNQYYYIQNVNPAILMGWIIFLEGIAVRKGKDVMARTESYGQARNFLRVHTLEDEGHIESAFKLLSFIDSSLLADITVNLKVSAAVYGSIFRRIQDMVSYDHPEKKPWGSWERTPGRA